jgi:superfamily II DNA/RNA helicase
VVRGLLKAGIAAHAIHGNKSQNQRERVLAAFRNGQVRTLVATDIAARGIDVDGISHVVNFDVPNVPETYVHRIGRTARAGAAGIAISLCDAEEAAYLRDIERLIRMSIPAMDHRSLPHQARLSTPQSRRAPTHLRGKQRQVDRGHAPRKQNRREQLLQGPSGIAAVAFLNRSARSANDGGSRRTEGGNPET